MTPGTSLPLPVSFALLVAFALPAAGQLDSLSAAHADLIRTPTVDGTVIAPATLTYGVRFDLPTREAGGELTRVIEPTTWLERDAWRVTERMDLGVLGSETRSFVLDRESLRTLRQRTGGAVALDLVYFEGGIAGTLRALGQWIEIDETFEGYASGAGSADALIMLAALPLEEGYTARLRVFDPTRSSLGLMHLKVTGTEEITVGAGSFDTFRLEMVSWATGQKSVLHAMRTAPHHVVRSRTTLPSNMSGATIRMELTAHDPIVAESP